MGVGETATRLVTVPRGGFQRQQIVTKIKVDGDAFSVGPVEIRIDEKFLAGIDLALLVFFYKPEPVPIIDKDATVNKSGVGIRNESALRYWPVWASPRPGTGEAR